MKKGFTLIELICILAIISIILAIASPSIGAYMRKDRLRLAAERLVNDLRYAKMYAMSKDAPEIRVMFERDAGKENYSGYRIYNPSDMGNPTIKGIKLPEGVEICSRLNGSTFDSTSSTITLTSSGGIMPYACTVALRDRDTGKKRFVTLTIGFTRIMEVAR